MQNSRNLWRFLWCFIKFEISRNYSDLKSCTRRARLGFREQRERKALEVVLSCRSCGTRPQERALLVQESIQKLRNFQESATFSENIWKYTKIHENLRKSAVIFENFLKSLEFFSNSRKEFQSIAKFENFHNHGAQVCVIISTELRCL